jgi:hypothetical protein
VAKSKDKHETGDSPKRAKGFIRGLLMGGLAGIWAMLLLVGGWLLRGRLAPEGK